MGMGTFPYFHSWQRKENGEGGRGRENILGLCTAPERNSIFYLLVLPEERLMILAKLENDFVLSAGRQRNWQMLFNEILKGGTAESSLISWKGQEPRTQLPHMLGPSLDSQGQLDGWTCSHGDCMSHLNLGLGMEKTLLSSAVVHPTACPVKARDCKSPIFYMNWKMTQEKILYYPNYKEHRPANTTCWTSGPLDLSKTGEGSQQEMVILVISRQGRKTVNPFSTCRPSTEQEEELPLL